VELEPANIFWIYIINNDSFEFKNTFKINIIIASHLSFIFIIIFEISFPFTFNSHEISKEASLVII